MGETPMAAEREHGRVELDGRMVRAMRGDLTVQQVDVVVNAANERLAHGGGVAAALARAGGPDVQTESDRWVANHGHLHPGHTAVTTAGEMPAKSVVHVVGPRYRDGQDNEGLLRQAVRVALDTARDVSAESVAMPAISSGIFGYPPDEAGRVIAEECVRWLGDEPGSVREIRLIGIDDDAALRFATGLDEWR
jgi:O-acetyl-ADP-ribose deacetylase